MLSIRASTRSAATARGWVGGPSGILRWSFGEKSELIGGKGATQKGPIAKNETQNGNQTKKMLTIHKNNYQHVAL